MNQDSKQSSLPTNNESPNWLLTAILIGIGAGILLGGLWPGAGKEIQFIGEIFIKALLMLVVPLVMTSMIVGISGLGDVRQLGGIGGKTVIYYMVTTAISVIIGIVMVNLIQPGGAGTREERIAMRGGELLVEAKYHINGNSLNSKRHPSSEGLRQPLYGYPARSTKYSRGSNGYGGNADVRRYGYRMN